VNQVKTTLVVLILLGALYGAYTVFNRPVEDIEASADWQEHGVEELKIEMGQAVSDPTALTPFDPGSLEPYTPGETPGGLVEFDPSAPTQPKAFDPSMAPPLAASEPPPISPVEAGSFKSSTTPSDGSGMLSTAQPGISTPGITQPGITQSGITQSAPLVTNPAPASPAPDYAKNYPTTNSNPTSQESFVGNVDIGNAPNVDSVSSVTTESSKEQLGLILGEARRFIDSQDYGAALAKLTVHHRDPDLLPEDQAALTEWLNLLARKVVYSTEAHVDAPYQAKPGDTLASIANQYDVPPSLLYNINKDQLQLGPQPSVDTPLRPGTSVKVVKGPFWANVDLDRQKLVLTVHGSRYFAGEFDISVGQDPAPRLGDYRVLEKKEYPAYSSNGQAFAQADPRNPYGNYLLRISGDGLCIHGSPEGVITDQGCIALGPVDAGDVFGILSENSKIEIRR